MDCVLSYRQATLRLEWDPKPKLHMLQHMVSRFVGAVRNFRINGYPKIGFRFRFAKGGLELGGRALRF